MQVKGRTWSMKMTLDDEDDVSPLFGKKTPFFIDFLLTVTCGVLQYISSTTQNRM